MKVVTGELIRSYVDPSGVTRQAGEEITLPAELADALFAAESKDKVVGKGKASAGKEVAGKGKASATAKDSTAKDDGEGEASDAAKGEAEK